VVRVGFLELNFEEIFKFFLGVNNLKALAGERKEEDLGRLFFFCLEADIPV
jgi:hypothetical protein